MVSAMQQIPDSSYSATRVGGNPALEGKFFQKVEELHKCYFNSLLLVWPSHYVISGVLQMKGNNNMKGK